MFNNLIKSTIYKINAYIIPHMYTYRKLISELSPNRETANWFQLYMMDTEKDG